MKIKLIGLIVFISFMSLSFNIQSVFATTITNGMSASNVLGQANFTSSTTATTQSGMNIATGSFYDSVNDRLFVSDHYNNRVLVYSTATISDGENAIYVLGQPNFTTNTSAVTQSKMFNPTGIAWDSNNEYLFVSDQGSNRILVYDLSGGITNGMNASYVLGQPNFTSDTGGFTQSTLCGPEGLYFNTVNNRLFVADSCNYRVLVFNFNVEGGIANGMNASYVLGQPDFTTDPTTVSLVTVNASTTLSTKGLAYDGMNQLLFVGDDTDSDDMVFHNRILVFNVSTIVNGEAAVNVIGKPDFVTGGENQGQDGFISIGGLVYDEAEADSNSYLYVADPFGHSVRVFDLSSGITNGMNASYVLGQSNFTDDTSGTTSSTVNIPGGLALDVSGDRFFLGDAFNNRVLVFDISTPLASGEGYTFPPQCSASFSPSTITLGQASTLSWNIRWSTDEVKKHSTYYVKVPTQGIFGPRTQSITMTPTSTTTIQLAATNLYGATFCDTKVTVLDTDGTEIVSTQNSYLTANTIKSPFGSMIVDFFKKLFGKK
jgi:sugar lactone lactonase YvrE